MQPMDIYSMYYDQYVNAPVSGKFDMDFELELYWWQTNTSRVMIAFHDTETGEVFNFRKVTVFYTADGKPFIKAGRKQFILENYSRVSF